MNKVKKPADITMPISHFKYFENVKICNFILPLTEPVSQKFALTNIVEIEGIDDKAFIAGIQDKPIPKRICKPVHNFYDIISLNDCVLAAVNSKDWAINCNLTSPREWMKVWGINNPYSFVRIVKLRKVDYNLNSLNKLING